MTVRVALALVLLALDGCGGKSSRSASAQSGTWDASTWNNAEWQ